MIESDSSAAPSFTLGLQHSDAIYSSTPDECAASSIPADSIAGDEIAKVTDSIAKSAFCPEIPFDAYYRMNLLH